MPAPPSPSPCPSGARPALGPARQPGTARRGGTGFPQRVAPVGEAGGVPWYAAVAAREHRTAGGTG